MPLLFQRSSGSENRPFNPIAIRILHVNVLAVISLTDADADADLVTYFRRLFFVTDAMMSGLSPEELLTTVDGGNGLR